MWARIQLKVGWLDLLAGAVSTVYGADRDRLVREVEAYWDTSGDTIAAYSVRSGFDLMLQALDLRPGDEVIFSAVNIKGMVKIVRKLGLVPVPVDLDIGHFAPSLERLKAAITPRSRVLVVAHLFGARLELDPVFELAREHGILIAEDCAQAFSGRGYPGHPKADVAMFSFGPLKTATALGGALIRVRDTALLARMRALQADYPMQTNAKQRKRVMQFAVMKIVTSRLVLQAIHRIFAARGRDYEAALPDKGPTPGARYTFRPPHRDVPPASARLAVTRRSWPTPGRPRPLDRAPRLPAHHKRTQGSPPNASGRRATHRHTEDTLCRLAAHCRSLSPTSTHITG